MNGNVAVPMMKDSVAPCFEVARYFMLARIGHDGKKLVAINECAGCQGYGRVRFLIENKVDIIICNGIKAFYRDLLRTSGITVIDEISGSAEQALDELIAGKMTVENRISDNLKPPPRMPHDDLVCWSRGLFESNGYTVSTRTGSPCVLIDLTAEITCPICGKAIRVAICCGAHTYNADQEIREFRYITAADYHAKAFVYPATPGLEKLCREYEIELISPNSDEFYLDRKPKAGIPILKNPIPGHEKAFRL